MGPKRSTICHPTLHCSSAALQLLCSRQIYRFINTDIISMHTCHPRLLYRCQMAAMVVAQFKEIKCTRTGAQETHKLGGKPTRENLTRTVRQKDISKNRACEFLHDNYVSQSETLGLTPKIWKQNQQKLGLHTATSPVRRESLANAIHLKNLH